MSHLNVTIAVKTLHLKLWPTSAANMICRFCTYFNRTTTEKSTSSRLRPWIGCFALQLGNHITHQLKAKYINTITFLTNWIKFIDFQTAANIFYVKKPAQNAVPVTWEPRLLLLYDNVKEADYALKWRSLLFELAFTIYLMYFIHHVFIGSSLPNTSVI